MFANSALRVGVFAGEYRNIGFGSSINLFFRHCCAVLGFRPCGVTSLFSRRNLTMLMVSCIPEL